ncbi:MAG: hypothetical protein JW950_04320 [Deltaproteobacteria bacterium]|nr:hypothetical protein [Deltaproteobacteria bacterium]
MGLKKYIFSILIIVLALNAYAQDGFRESGQFSSWVNVNSGSDLYLWGGARYIPQFNYRETLKNGHFLDAELSANIYGSTRLRPFDSHTASGGIDLYRAWVRGSTDQFELRLGLQKLNFGSAVMLRPLMWFDQMDAQDPLKLTDGVWGALARYYLLNNTNIWLWCLYGNDTAMGWDLIPSNKETPEFGGRVQLPVPRGEIALTYHNRVADSRSDGGTVPGFQKIPENRIGFDAKWDITIGLWVEGSYSKKEENLGALTNQLILNAGADYTFGIGSGLYMAYEQLLASFDAEPFAFDNKALFSAMTASYPVGTFDKLGTTLYYDWEGGNMYSFLNWQRQFDHVMLYVMAYWNPQRFDLPAQSGGLNIFAGKGIQIMFVFDH